MIRTASPQIELRRLHRVFDETHAVNDVSFEVYAGEVFGYIGPNGAGKTTSMRILATLDEPTSGDAFVERREDSDRKSTRLNSSHLGISYAVFCLKKKKRLHTRIS